MPTCLTRDDNRTPLTVPAATPCAVASDSAAGTLGLAGRVDFAGRRTATELHAWRRGDGRCAGGWNAGDRGPRARLAPAAGIRALLDSAGFEGTGVGTRARLANENLADDVALGAKLAAVVIGPVRCRQAGSPGLAAAPPETRLVR